MFYLYSKKFPLYYLYLLILFNILFYFSLDASFSNSLLILIGYLDTTFNLSFVSILSIIRLNLEFLNYIDIFPSISSLK
jgi:hypothetical protein